MWTNTIVEVIYGIGPDPYDPNHYRQITETGLYLNRLPDGRAEILITPDKIVQCSENRLTVRCAPETPGYAVLRARLWPELSLAA